MGNFSAQWLLVVKNQISTERFQIKSRLLAKRPDTLDRATVLLLMGALPWLTYSVLGSI